MKKNPANIISLIIIVILVIAMAAGLLYVTQQENLAETKKSQDASQQEKNITEAQQLEKEAVSSNDPAEAIKKYKEAAELYEKGGKPELAVGLRVNAETAQMEADQNAQIKAEEPGSIDAATGEITKQ